MISKTKKHQSMNCLSRDRLIHVGVLGSFSGEETRFYFKDTYSFRVINRQNFDEMLADIRPSLLAESIQCGDNQEPSLCQIRIDSLCQFSPQSLEQSAEFSKVIEQYPQLLLDAKGSQKTKLQLAEEILSRDGAKSLKSSWTGLHHIVYGAPGNVQIRLLDVTKMSFSKVLRKYKGTAWDQSPLFKMIYEQEVGSLGGEPFSLIVGDYYFSHLPRDVESLREMSQICAAAGCIFLAGASPRLLGREVFDVNDRLSNVGRLFNTGEYASWRSMRSQEESRWVSLALPRTLLSNAYREQSVVQGKRSQKPSGSNYETVWVNAAYIVASNFLTQFSGHYGHVGIASGSSREFVSGLPVVGREPGEKGTSSSVEFDFTTRNQAELEGLGITVLSPFRDSDKITYTGPLSLGISEANLPSNSIRALVIASSINHGISDRLGKIKGPVFRLEQPQAIMDQELESMLGVLPDHNEILAGILNSIRVVLLKPDEDGYWRKRLGRATLKVEFKIKTHPVKPPEHLTFHSLTTLELTD